MSSAYVVMKRKPLHDVPWFYRWLARWVYFRIGWASDHSLELQGIYTEESAARHAASGTGMCYMELPVDECLPLETCQNGKHDYPLSDASSDYRNRRLPFVAVSREDLDALDEKITQTLNCASGKCVPKAV